MMRPLAKPPRVIRTKGGTPILIAPQIYVRVWLVAVVLILVSHGASWPTKAIAISLIVGHLLVGWWFISSRVPRAQR
jgi:hypothetical protein